MDHYQGEVLTVAGRCGDQENDTYRSRSVFGGIYQR